MNLGIARKARQAYFLAVQAGMGRDYEPMKAVFRAVLRRSGLDLGSRLAAAGRAFPAALRTPSMAVEDGTLARHDSGQRLPPWRCGSCRSGSFIMPNAWWRKVAHRSVMHAGDNSGAGRQTVIGERRRSAEAAAPCAPAPNDAQVPSDWADLLARALLREKPESRQGRADSGAAQALALAGNVAFERKN